MAFTASLVQLLGSFRNLTSHTTGPDKSPTTPNSWHLSSTKVDSSIFHQRFFVSDHLQRAWQCPHKSITSKVRRKAMAATRPKATHSIHNIPSL